jgi:hypothetical protein
VRFIFSDLRGVATSFPLLRHLQLVAGPDPELRGQNGILLKADDDWEDDPAQGAEITAAGLAPSNTKESAIAATPLPGLYTAILTAATLPPAWGSSKSPTGDRDVKSASFHQDG